MLTKSQIRFLRAQAHHLHPLVLLGANGLTAAVHQEIDHALESHELIKVKLGQLPNDVQQQMITEISAKEAAECVQKIGHTAIFFRRNPQENKYQLPKK